MKCALKLKNHNDQLRIIEEMKDLYLVICNNNRISSQINYHEIISLN